ncbi:MAG: hypothetical protein GWN64_14775 [Candidatus Thorarchaeota archaeon]|nr:hypothetical protein [Candidatus Thorarchaeota archaeon]
MIELQPGDQLTLCYNYCEFCSAEIGYDEYGMDCSEGVEVTIYPHNLELSDYVSDRVSGCEAKVFEYDGWYWTTCWIKNYIPVHREPNWEV